MDLYGARQIAPFKGCWPLLAAMLAGMAYNRIVTAGVLRPPRRQGLHDRLAHVVVLHPLSDLARQASMLTVQDGC